MKKDQSKKLVTEALIVENGKILLGKKKRKFGVGKWLGFGGKVEKGEKVEDTLIRECCEECGIKVKEFKKRGILTFYYENDPNMKVHYYEILKYTGKPQDSEEMKVKWFNLDKIPYEKMFPNDRYWLPMFLKKEFFKGEFWFDKNYEITKYDIRKVSKKTKI